MAKITAAKAEKTGRSRAARRPARASESEVIRFEAKLNRPADPTGATWTFLRLPRQASAKLRSRSMVSVEGAINGRPFQATLEPDGEGGHWLKVDQRLGESAGARAGDVVALELRALPPEREPEPDVPADVQKALAAASANVKAAWAGITPIGRRDFIHWISSAKQAETRARRIANACDMLAKGKRRPCCFDRSGMYDKSLGCPVAAVDPAGEQ